MSNFAVINTFNSGCSGSSIEPSSKFSEGEGEGTKNIEGAGVGSIPSEKLLCKKKKLVQSQVKISLQKQTYHFYAMQSDSIVSHSPDLHAH